MLTDEEKLTKKAYDNIAGLWVGQHFNLGLWAAEYQEFKKYLPRGKIIDLGCGGGRDSLWFINNGYGYVGIDFSEKMLDEARKKNPRAEFIKKSFYKLDFPASSFDGFWSACALLHIPKPKLPGVLQSIKKILKSGGVGFISIKPGLGQELENQPEYSNPRFFAYYEAGEFAEILKAAGFIILSQGVRPRDSLHDSDFLTFFIRKPA